MLSNLAERAVELNLCRPEVSDEEGIRIRKGRHLVVETLGGAPFVPNDLDLGPDRRMLVVTGPNMGGKSTYMRQTAHIVLLAYAGSCVPPNRPSSDPWTGYSPESAPRTTSRADARRSWSR